MREEIKRVLKGQEFSLGDLIDIKAWQRIQDNFSAVTEVSLRLVDAKGVAITKPSGEPRLCTNLLKNPVVKKKVCGACLPTFLGGKAVLDKNLVFVCEVAGLHNFATPLTINGGKVLGYLLVGPVTLVMLKPKEDYRKVAEELDLDLEDLWSAIIEIKAISFHGVQSLVELIKGVGEFTLRLAYQNKIKEKEVIMAADLPKLSKLLDALLDVAFEISGADIGSVMFFDKANDELTIRASRGISNEIVRNTRVKLGSGISGIAAKEGKSFLIDENTKDSRIRPYLNRPYISSSMIVPLKIEERVLGVMNLGTLDTSLVRFSQDNMGLMRKLADLATVAIRP